MNNEKYLKGLKVHRPTISELVARQIKEAAASDKKLDEQINRAMAKGVPFITLEHDRILISSPDPAKTKYFKQDGDKIEEQKNN